MEITISTSQWTAPTTIKYRLSCESLAYCLCSSIAIHGQIGVTGAIKVRAIRPCEKKMVFLNVANDEGGLIRFNVTNHRNPSILSRTRPGPVSSNGVGSIFCGYLLKWK